MNIYDNTVNGCLSGGNVRQFYAHCTIPMFDDGSLWMDTWASFDNPQLRRMGIKDVWFEIRIMSSFGTECSVHITYKNGDENKISWRTGDNILVDNKPPTAEFLVDQLFTNNNNALNRLQLCAVANCIELMVHKLKPTWIEQAKQYIAMCTLTDQHDD